MEKYYVNTVSYGQYIRNVIMPYEKIISNPRNSKGVKNTGERDVKMLNSNIRSKTSAIRKAYHNFSKSKKLTFLTLTYALNETNVKKCKQDLNKFFKALKYYFKKINKTIKYFYTYEYQTRGAVHFHILIDAKLPNNLILKNWTYGLNKNILVRQKTNEAVVKYCSKYITKNVLNSKSQNQFDLNVKAYQFSYNCENPKSLRRIWIGTVNSLVDKVIGSSFFKFLKTKVNNLTTKLSGVIFEFPKKQYVDFKNTSNYSSLESTRCKNFIRQKSAELLKC